MTGRAPDTSAAAAIRDASIHGQAKAVRELLDALHKHRNPNPLTMPADPWAAYLRGYDQAVALVKAYRVDDRPETQP